MTWGDVATPITTMGSAAGATLAFRVGNELRVAAVVKATFILSPDAAMVLVDPEPILRADQPRDRAPSSSLVAASEMVPYRPRADLLLSGHARAPRDRPTPAMGVRLMVARGAEVVLDKRLAVRGTPDPGGHAREPSPFTAMLLAWELAAAGPDNPAGIHEGPRAWPHIVDPKRRDEPAGFGPISPRWPSRARLLTVDERAFAAPLPTLPPDFPWAYFNAAPEDQRLDFFRGDEWIGFEGMNSQLPRVQSCLPGVVARARVYGPTPQLIAGPSIPLEADTVTIDADRLRCSVVWRGSFPVAGARPEDLAALHVFAGVETPGAPLAFPDAYPGRPSDRPGPAVAAPRGRVTEESVTQDLSPPAAAPHGPPRVTADRDAGMATLALDLSALASARATPFEPPAKPKRPFGGERLPLGTPFDPARLGPAPAPRAADATIDLASLPVAADDDGLLAALAGTLPIDSRAPPNLGRPLPFASPGPSPASTAGPRPRAPDPGSTMDLGALIAGSPLPFGPARPPAEPRAEPPPHDAALRAGSTMALPAMFATAALPFGGQAQGPPTDAHRSSRPPVPNPGATMDLSALVAANPLPFQAGGALPPPVEAWAPAPAILPEPVAMVPSTFAPLPAPWTPPLAAAAPGAPALAPEDEGEPPQTLGAHFLAAMARAGRARARPAR